MRYYSVYPPPIYNATAALQGTPYVLAARTYLILLALLTIAGACLLAAAVPELGTWRLPFAIAMAFSPAAFMGMLSGQLAGLWLALLGGGLLLLRTRRPIVAGLVLGLLCAKPSVGVPVAGMLLLTGNLRAFCGFVGGERRCWAAGPLELVAVSIGLLVAATAARHAFRLDPADPRWPLRAGAVLSGLFVGLPYLMGYDQGLHGLAVVGTLLVLKSGDVARPRVAMGLLAAFVLGPFLNPLSQAAHFSFGGLALVAWYVWVRMQVERRD
jgi:hypothetical protein